jgi:hypothetical protein
MSWKIKKMGRVERNTRMGEQKGEEEVGVGGGKRMSMEEKKK